MADLGNLPPVQRRRWPVLLPLATVWVIALVPPALWLVHRGDPELAVRLALAGSTWTTRTLLALALLAAAALLLFPPAAAGVRLAAARTRRLLASDRGPLQRALADLQHFESAARHLDAGRAAWLLDDGARALVHLRRAIELDPALPAAHHQLGLVLLRTGHAAPARQAFAAAERLDPGHAFGDALLHQGRAAFRLGQHADAVELLRTHERRHGGGRRSQLWLGDALAAAGDRAAARAAWSAAAAPGRLTAEENWCRALARVRPWFGGRA
ncbi:MAG: tetratricopeptide repeat protein [Planctomycetes bacterium]|nr:tetratricopeptide repeat protein [Planctomycetota bacterium]